MKSTGFEKKSGFGMLWVALPSGNVFLARQGRGTRGAVMKILAYLGHPSGNPRTRKKTTTGISMLSNFFCISGYYKMEMIYRSWSFLLYFSKIPSKSPCHNVRTETSWVSDFSKSKKNVSSFKGIGSSPKSVKYTVETTKKS